ncbi:hypothetical protein [Gimesia sp.]|uniref:hypothetical protein n=1 Tax=Gimesia sp. TaxID=2024833 RepID=UPI003A8D1810
MEPAEAYSRYVLNILNSDEIVSLADSWLNQGIFTDSLNTLCWEKEPIMSSVGPLFEKAMNELGVNKPDSLEAGHLIVRETLTRVVDLELPPEKGAAFLYHHVYPGIRHECLDEVNYGDGLDLERIFGLMWELEDCRGDSLIPYYSDLPRSEAEAKMKLHLIDESRKWLEKNHN